MRASSEDSRATGTMLPSTVRRGCARASPFPYSASSSEARPSHSRLAVWVASRDTRISGEPSMSVATLASEANGWPLLRSIVASVAARVARSSDLATARGSKSAGGRAFSGMRPGMAPGSGRLAMAGLGGGFDVIGGLGIKDPDLGLLSAPVGVEITQESHSCCKEVTFQPPFMGFKTRRTSTPAAYRGSRGAHADNRSRRRRPQYTHIRLDGPRV